MKKIILITVVCLIGLFVTGCTSQPSESDTTLELKGLGFENPSNMSDQTEPFEVWAVHIPSVEKRAVLIAKSDDGWIYYPKLMNDITTAWAIFEDQDVQITMHKSDSPSIRARKTNYISTEFVSSIFGIKPDWSSNSSDDMYFIKTANGPSQWALGEPSAANNYKEPGYIADFSIQTIKDGASQFFADDPHGVKILTDESDLAYKEIYSIVWDFEKGELRK